MFGHSPILVLQYYLQWHDNILSFNIITTSHYSRIKCKMQWFLFLCNKHFDLHITKRHLVIFYILVLTLVSVFTLFLLVIISIRWSVGNIWTSLFLPDKIHTMLFWCLLYLLGDQWFDAQVRQTPRWTTNKRKRSWLNYGWRKKKSKTSWVRKWPSWRRYACGKR